MERTKKLFKNTAYKKEAIFFLFIFVVFILKYTLYGFKYFPVLDDYIQYGGYPMYNDMNYVLFNIGTIASRPIASFLDIAFWGKLWNMPCLMLVFSCILHFLSCILFYRTAKENNIKLSLVFAIFYLFFPLGYEGSFWISASSRIICGLFFSSVALLYLTKYEHSGKLRFFIVFFLCSLCAFTLYEACAVFCFLASAIIIFLNRKENRYILPAISLLLMLFALLIYMSFAKDIGNMGSRVSESSFIYIFTQLGEFFTQLAEIMINGFFSLTIQGFKDGLLVLFGKGLWGIINLILIFAGCIIIGSLFSAERKESITKAQLFFQIAAGIILFFAPFAPNLIAKPVWITYRTMFVPLIGLYLIFDVLFLSISKKSVQTILLMVLLFIFTVSSVNEYDTYKRTNELDSKLLSKICFQLDESVLSGEKEVAVLLKSPPSVRQTSYYKDHVKTVFYDDWALTGAVRAHLKNINIKKVTPVYPDTNFDYSDCFVVDLTLQQ